ncbi:MAG: glycosyl transferase [Hyphomicrobiales bacterium]|nr:MAG: glycosyl transferase [Hyphomicrobiales bacterium]
MTQELFLTAVKKAISQDLSVADLFGVTEQLKAAGENALALQLYDIWIGQNAANPLLHAVRFNYGVALSDDGKLERARDVFLEAIKTNPEFIPPYINIGTLYERLGQLDQSIAHWTQAANVLGAITAESINYKLTALKQIGRVLEGAKIDANAEAVLRQSLEIDPFQRDVSQHWIALRQGQCKWPVIEPFARMTRRRLMKGISPLSTACQMDDPIFQLANAYHYNQTDVLKGSKVPAAWAPPKGPRNRRLRIGYVSSDLREHAVGFLTAEIFGLHDRSKVEVFGYYSGVKTNDAMQARIKATFDHWADITDYKDEAAIQKIRDDGIDILIDLNGYSKDARLNVFAARPAPIIVNWLGFPGTMGSPYHNYIIADDFIIPKEHEAYFTEKVLRLPCYQPNDRKRAVADCPTRAQVGLPEGAIVYCCFNGTQKITAQTYDQWMQILRGVPNSVLWLLSGSDETNERLKVEAEKRGVSRERIVIADKRANAHHLARYRLADLFLDTFPYGAHTTASDALWLGVPILTYPGRGFAARVCGSLVIAAGLPELVCASQEHYVRRAMELGNDPALLKAMRAKLELGRASCTLFDMPRLVQSLEGLYEEMWTDYAEGRLPLPDLSNLEVLHDIGCEEGHDERVAKAQDLTAYHGVYRDSLAARGAYSTLAYDRRLRVRNGNDPLINGLVLPMRAAE